MYTYNFSNHFNAIINNIFKGKIFVSLPSYKQNADKYAKTSISLKKKYRYAKFVRLNAVEILLIT